MTVRRKGSAAPRVLVSARWTMPRPRTVLGTLLLLLGLGCGRQNAHADADVRVEAEIATETAAVDVAADGPRDAPLDLPLDTPADVRDARVPEANVTLGCPPWAPISQAGNCFECTNDSHCACGYCLATGTCSFYGSASCGCVSPYPFCLTTEGQLVCVECFADKDCPYGCGCADHTCVQPEGDTCPRLSAGCADDCVTAGCPDPEQRWGALSCDHAAGCCTSPDAGCDDRFAFCTHAGSTCRALRDIVGISAAIWLSGTEACDGYATGYCTCDLAEQAACAGAQPGTVPGCCPSGQMCIAAADLFRRLVGDEAAVPPVDPTGWAFCVVEAH